MFKAIVKHSPNTDSVSALPAQLLLLLALALGACAATTVPTGSDEITLRDGNQTLLVQTLSEALDEPWGMDFLPDGRLLVTEKPGTMRLFDADLQASINLGGVPEVANTGQGGLMDVLVHPDFDRNALVYLSYSVREDGGTTTRVSRARLLGDQLQEMEVLFTASPAFRQRRHYGSRLYIDDESYLFLSVGDRGNRDRAQRLDSHNGKIMRLHDDGSVPADNPYVGTADALPEIWSYGHRNPQGMAAHPQSGALFISEHGPQGGDEVNAVRPGVNYGWPVITYGEEYGGGKIGEGTAQEGMEQPLAYWVPSIGTGGIAFYTDDHFPGWEPSLLVAGLRKTQISRVALTEEGLGARSEVLTDLRLRIRDLQFGPDGALYVLAGDDRLLRVSPGE